MWLDFLKFAGPTFFPLWKSELQGIHGPRFIALTYKPGLESEAFPHPLEYTRRQVGPLEELNKSAWSPGNGTVMALSSQAVWIGTLQHLESWLDFLPRYAAI